MGTTRPDGGKVLFHIFFISGICWKSGKEEKKGTKIMAPQTAGHNAWNTQSCFTFSNFSFTSKRRGNCVTFPTQIQTVFSECLFSTLGLLSSQPDSKMRWKPVASNRSPLLIKFLGTNKNHLTLPETKSSKLKIGHPKRTFHLPSQVSSDQNPPVTFHWILVGYIGILAMTYEIIPV